MGKSIDVPLRTKSGTNEKLQGFRKSKVRVSKVSNNVGSAGKYAAHELDLMTSLSQITLLSTLIDTYGINPEHTDGAVWE